MSPEKKKVVKKAVKKSVAKKTVKKVVSRKSVAKKVTPKKTVKNSSPSQGLGWVPWVLTLGLFGLLCGIFFADFNIAQKFSAHRDMVVIGDQTWMPVPGKPVDVVVLNDKNCEKCDTTATLDALRQNVTPALIVREIDINNGEGKAMVKNFNLTSVPQYFFGKNIEDIKADDGTRFVDNLPEGVFTLKDGLYVVNGAAVGFPVGKFIKAPEFADIDSEPKQGTGPIQIVEFTDYQCPFCKRLFDNNKSLIERLVKENKITYILKDFPLSFHGEAKYAHQAANCVLKEGGNDKYWKMHDSIFDNNQDWSGIGAAAEKALVGMASDLDVDIEACMSDESVALEINADAQEGAKYGVSGTPALFIGTQFMPGAIGPDVLEAAVEQELK